MKIQQLFLRNVRSIRSLDLDFRDPVTGKPMSRVVLAGANGSGKTAILDAVFTLVGALKTSSDDERLNWVWPLERTQSSVAQVICEFGLTEVPPLLISDYAGEKSIQISSYVGEEPILEDFPIWPDEDAAVEFVGEIMHTRGKPNIIYFPHGRELVSVALDQLTVEEVIWEWAYRYENRSQWAGSVESFLVWQNYLDLEDRDKGKPAERFKRIATVVNNILVDKQISKVERGRVVVETRLGESHSLNDLSSGEKQLLLLLIEISRRIVPGSVILIDEPEISLHPTWQRGLVAALDKIIEQYDAQVIMATHSLDIASMVLPHEVIILSDLDVPPGQWEPAKEALA